MPPELLEGAGQGSDVTTDPKESAAAPVAAEPPRAFVDVDDLELYALREAAKAEERESAAGPDGSTTQAQPGSVAQPDQSEPQPQPIPGRKPMPAMIPKARFDELNRDKQALEARIAELSKAPRANEAPAASQRIAAIDQSVLDLAKKFDSGEISAAEWKAQEQTLQNERGSLVEADILSKVNARPAATNPESPVADLIIEERTADLEARYDRFVNLIPQGYLDGVVAEARASFAAEGIDVPPNARGTLMLQEKVGQIAFAKRAVFSQLSGRPVPDDAPAPKPQGAPTKPAAVVTGQITPAQRLAKLEMQSTMPPNVGQMTRSEDLNELPNEATLEGMDDEDIMKLPVGVRNTYLGIAKPQS